MVASPSLASAAVADAAELLASRIQRAAERLDVATAQLAGVGPPEWRGPAQAAFDLARAAALDRLAAAAAAARDSAAVARRAAELARIGAEGA